jgi:UDP-N-acetyl-D-glucosamine dehydrogenase
MNKNYFKHLNNLISKKKAVIGVIGLGYVGLPLSILFVNKGFKICGFDIDKAKIKKIFSNISYIDRIENKLIKKLNYSGKFSHNFKNISLCDVIVICVPTPLKNNNPYTNYIKSTYKYIEKFLKPGQVIILESTSYPGTTNELIVKKIEKEFKIGKNFFVGFSSERINPGFNENSIHKVPKVVSGQTKECLKIINNFYSNFFSTIVRCKSIEIAEFSKLLENIYRAVNISFINEMKLVAQRFNLDIFDIIKVAATKPFGFKRFDPGPGTGGHCIPIDPKYLYYKSSKLGFKPKFIELAGETNLKVLKNIASLTFKNLRERKISNNKAKILILGIAYKKNIDDLRESAALNLINILKKKIKNIDFSDPYIKSFIKTRTSKIDKKSIKISAKILRKYDLTILMTDHDNFDYKVIYKNSNFIIDTRGKFQLDNKVIRG